MGDDGDFNLLDCFDYFTPLSALIREWLQDGNTCQIPYDCLDMPWNTLRDYLAERYIETWGWGTYHGLVTFSYRKQDEARLLSALNPPGGLHAPENLGGVWAMLQTAALCVLIPYVLYSAESYVGAELPVAIALLGGLIGLLSTNGGLFFGSGLYLCLWALMHGTW